MELAGSRILVTGGAGFIGSHLAGRLLDLGASVHIIDNLSTGVQANIPLGAAFHYLDLSSPGFPKTLPAGPFDAVCHLAAQSSGEVSHADPVYDLSVNATSTLLLAHWCQQLAIPRFVYASSMAVYGDVNRLPVSEEHPCQPLSYYGISKLVSEHYIRLAQAKGLPTTVFRMFSVYGPGQNLDNLKQGMVSIYLAYLLKGSPIPVKGSLDRVRDQVYIDDVVDAWVQALLNPAAAGKTYNLGSGHPTRVGELLALLVEAFGGSSEAHRIVREEPTPGDQMAVYADISRIQADLRWTPHTELRDGLTAMVAWAKSLKSAVEA